MNRHCLPFGLLLGFFSALVANGAEVYRCVENGKTTILTEPCPERAKSERILVDQVSVEAAQASSEMLTRQKEEADRMEQARLQREAIDAEWRRELALQRMSEPQPEPERENDRVGVYLPYPVYAPNAPFRHQIRPYPTRRPFTRPWPPPRRVNSGPPYRGPGVGTGVSTGSRTTPSGQRLMVREPWK